MRCSQKECGEVAAYTYVWPGRSGREYACPVHAMAAKRIADACGFTLGDARVCTAEEIVADGTAAKE